MKTQFFKNQNKNVPSCYGGLWFLTRQGDGVSSLYFKGGIKAGLRLAFYLPL